MNIFIYTGDKRDFEKVSTERFVKLVNAISEINNSSFTNRWDFFMTVDRASIAEDIFYIITCIDMDNYEIKIMSTNIIIDLLSIIRTMEDTDDDYLQDELWEEMIGIIENL